MRHTFKSVAFLYTPEALTHEQILNIIDDYGQATRRAIEAGFDGVEIHGANHYLPQQFFSSYSNICEDDWGGSMEKRIAFSIAVIKKVKEIVAQNAAEDFIVGYRISPEEVHGANVSYTIDDAVILIDEIVNHGIDYLHVSSADYKAMPQTSGHGEAIALTVKKCIRDRIPMLLAGGILTPDDALDAPKFKKEQGILMTTSRFFISRTFRLIQTSLKSHSGDTQNHTRYHFSSKPNSPHRG